MDRRFTDVHSATQSSTTARPLRHTWRYTDPKDHLSVTIVAQLLSEKNTSTDTGHHTWPNVHILVLFVAKLSNESWVFISRTLLSQWIWQLTNDYVHRNTCKGIQLFIGRTRCIGVPSVGKVSIARITWPSTSTLTWPRESNKSLANSQGKEGSSKGNSNRTMTTIPPSTFNSIKACWHSYTDINHAWIANTNLPRVGRFDSRWPTVFKVTNMFFCSNNFLNSWIALVLLPHVFYVIFITLVPGRGINFGRLSFGIGVWETCQDYHVMMASEKRIILKSTASLAHMKMNCKA